MIQEALSMNRPGEEYILDGDSLDGLTWLSDTPPPTNAEIASGWKAYQAAQKQQETARAAAIAHAKNLGFTDEMIAVMYPTLNG